MESSEQGNQETQQSLPSLLESASERVQAIIDAAEVSAGGILEDARQEARRYADEARDRIDEVSRERTKRVGELTNELTNLGEELIRQAETMRTQAHALAAALTNATNEIYTDLAEQEQQLDRLEGDELVDELDVEPYGLAPAFEDEEGTMPLEEEPIENGQPADRFRRSFSSLFRRHEDEPGTSELAVIEDSSGIAEAPAGDSTAEQDEEADPVS